MRTSAGMDGSKRPRKLPIVLSLMIAFGFAVGAGCDEEEEGGAISCEYEVASTGCSGSGNGFGDYEYRCLTIEDPKAGFTAEDLCDEVAAATTNCESTCCVSYSYRDLNAFNGTCD